MGGGRTSGGLTPNMATIAAATLSCPRIPGKPGGGRPKGGGGGREGRPAGPDAGAEGTERERMGEREGKRSINTQK